MVGCFHSIWCNSRSLERSNHCHEDSRQLELYNRRQCLRVIYSSPFLQPSLFYFLATVHKLWALSIFLFTLSVCCTAWPRLGGPWPSFLGQGKHWIFFPSSLCFSQAPSPSCVFYERERKNLSKRRKGDFVLCVLSNKRNIISSWRTKAHAVLSPIFSSVIIQ